MAWPIGISWTKGKWMPTENPDGTTAKLYVCSGPLYYNPSVFGLLFIYCGARPTPTWAEGYGDEGYLGFVARWMKRHGFGNYGVAIKGAR